jgi:hypothetical protein
VTAASLAAAGRWGELPDLPIALMLLPAAMPGLAPEPPGSAGPVLRIPLLVAMFLK